MPRLLVLEDEKNIADLICRVGEEVGFEARAVCHFEEIPTLCSIFVPDAIVLDIVMPEMDGFEVLNFLHKQNSNSRVVIISGQGDYRSMALRMAEGLGFPIAATLAKPFRVPELRDILTEIKDSIPAHSSEGKASELWREKKLS